MDIYEERQLYLNQELEEYEKVTPMTEEERKALREWVADGNSVHENGSYGVWEGGRPIDFLDVYRWEMEELEAFNAMSKEEQDAFIKERTGTGDDMFPFELPDGDWEGEFPWERP